METKQKAARNQRLLNDEAFQDAVAEVRQAQLNAFANSGASDTAAREEAHAILRGITQFLAALKAPVTDLAVEEKKKDRHRGSDRT
jgi:hypothetical protein